MNLPSKELLSEVLKCKDNVEFCQDDNYIVIGYDGESHYDINLYELAHKCKEWAFHKGYDIIETDFMISIRKKSNMHFFKVYEYTEEEQKEQDVFKPEYTFKVCQLILENK